jgi:hypothetical protein
MLSRLNGHKTYILAVLAIAYAIYGWLVLGTLPQNDAIDIIFVALGAGSLRHGITTAGK